MARHGAGAAPLPDRRRRARRGAAPRRPRRRARGTKAGLDELAALEHDLAKTDLAELVAYLSAEHLEALGDTRAARDAYVRIADRWPYPYGAFFDGALWKASLLDEKLGQPAFGGRRPRAHGRGARDDDPDGQLRAQATTCPPCCASASLYRDELGDHAKAREAFHRLYTDFAHSTMRDDALWLEAALWKQDGDARTACERLGTLVHEFPDSRYVPCATAQCPGLGAAEGQRRAEDVPRLTWRGRAGSRRSSRPGPREGGRATAPRSLLPLPRRPRLRPRPPRRTPRPRSRSTRLLPLPRPRRPLRASRT